MKPDEEVKTTRAERKAKRSALFSVTSYLERKAKKLRDKKKARAAKKKK